MTFMKRMLVFLIGVIVFVILWQTCFPECMFSGPDFEYDIYNMWVISKVLHTVFFSLKMNLFYKIHLQAFNVISIVLCHSGPTFGQVLYSCQDAFVVDASDYSGHLIRHLVSASEAFPKESFLQFWEQVKDWWAHVRTVRGGGSTCRPYFSKISDTAPEAWGHALMYDGWSLREIWFQSVSSSISRLRFAEHGRRSLPIHIQCSLLKSGSQLSRKSERLRHPTDRASAVCRTFEMTYVLDILVKLFFLLICVVNVS